MPTNEEMRERALAFAKDGEFAERVTAFAASEVSRAVQECIEAACVHCASGEHVERFSGDRFSAATWGHENGRDFTVYCDAEEIHELLYQQQHSHASEAQGEEGGE